MENGLPNPANPAVCQNSWLSLVVIGWLGWLQAFARLLLFDPILFGTGSEKGSVGFEDLFNVGPKALDFPTDPFRAEAAILVDLTTLLESLEQLPSGPLEVDLVRNESQQGSPDGIVLEAEQGLVGLGGRQGFDGLGLLPQGSTKSEGESGKVWVPLIQTRRRLGVVGKGGCNCLSDPGQPRVAGIGNLSRQVSVLGFAPSAIHPDDQQAIGEAWVTGEGFWSSGRQGNPTPSTMGDQFLVGEEFSLGSAKTRCNLRQGVREPFNPCVGIVRDQHASGIQTGPEVGFPVVIDG